MKGYSMQDIFNLNSSTYHKDLLNLLSSTLPDMLWVKDLEGKYIFVNQAICDGLLMANDINEPIGKDDTFFALRERAKYKEIKDWHTFGELCFNSDLEVLENEQPMRFEEYGNIKGKLLYLEVNKAPFYDNNGVLRGTVGSGRDITEYKKLQNILENEQYRLKESQRIANVGSWEIEIPSGKTIWSDRLYAIFNEDKEHFIPSEEAFFNFLNEEDKQSVAGKIQGIITKGNIIEMKYAIHRRDKKIVHLLSRAEAVYNKNGKAIKIVGSSMDITDSTELNLQLLKQSKAFEYQANHDALTDLPNRTLFFKKLEDSLVLAKLHQTKVAVLFIDLDHFKEINDSLGHDVGDKVLIEVAKRMQGKMRSSDVLSRLGGDEFSIILNNIKDYDMLLNIIKSGMEILEKSIMIDNHELHLSMSVGASLYPFDGTTPLELLKNADTAMFNVKNNSRNDYCFYKESLSKSSSVYISLENAMYQGLKNDEFVPYFQPQVDLKTGKLAGMELLVRWEHPIRGLISPAEFIPLAEKSGHIINLDRQLMDKAMKHFIGWKKMGLKTGTLSINLASQQLASDTFFKILKEMTIKNSCPASYLELEVTESEVMKEPDRAIQKLEQLHNMGFQLAIDDFGTGYSSLSYLKRFPIDKLKIDRSFIKDIPNNKEDSEITKLIIGLCNILGIKSLAEGVETKEQKDFLKESGCQLIQGFYYSKPLSASDMLAYLKKQ